MKYLVFLFCIATTYAANCQVKQNFTNPWGTWGVGNISTKLNLFVFEKVFHIEGYHLYYNWSDLEAEKNTFVWEGLDEKLQLLADADIWIGVQIMVGQNSPSWIYDKVPEVVTTGGGDPGPYPYYLDSDYQKRYFNLLKKVATHLNNLPQHLKEHLMYWQICEGSTGDEQPYKGTPVDSAYEIDYYTWQGFRHQCWDSASTYAGKNRYFRFLFNSGNNSQDLQYVESKFPEDFQKSGWLSHQYSFNGELLYYSRQIRRLESTFYGYRTRGEIQGVYNYPWWKMASVKQSFTLACSALAGGLDMLNVGAAYIDATQDTRPTDFFKKYAGLRNASGANRGFIALRDVPDFMDTSRFPVQQYGPVINPLSQKAFDSRIKQIQGNEKDSATLKYWKTIEAIEKYLNPVRRDVIIDEFTPAGAMYNDDGDGYHNDFGINMTKNFARFIRQVSPDNTSIGAWRIGADSSMYGRYARLCKLDANNNGEMFFRLNDSLLADNKNVTLTITYYNIDTGKWAVRGSGTTFNFKNKYKNDWMQKTVTFTGFKGRQLLNGDADFSIKYKGGVNTPFALIEVSIQEAQNMNLVTGSKVKTENLNLKLSPNPNNGRFRVELNAPLDEVYSVSVTDMSGTKILSENRSATVGLNTWDFFSSKLQKGVYILHVQSSNAIATRNFIVEK